MSPSTHDWPRSRWERARSPASRSRLRSYPRVQPHDGSACCVDGLSVLIDLQDGSSSRRTAAAGGEASLDGLVAAEVELLRSQFRTFGQ